MVTLYRRPDDPQADDIQDTLDDMVIAYETNIVDTPHGLPDDVASLPALRDDEDVITGEEALRDRLDRLRELMEDWNRFQSDACYIEDDGTIC